MIFPAVNLQSEMGISHGQGFFFPDGVWNQSNTIIYINLWLYSDLVASDKD